MELYADIIIDISYSGLDKTFQYRIPEELQEVLEPEMWQRCLLDAATGCRKGMCSGLLTTVPVRRKK